MSNVKMILDRLDAIEDKLDKLLKPEGVKLLPEPVKLKKPFSIRKNNMRSAAFGIDFVKCLDTLMSDGETRSLPELETHLIKSGYRGKAKSAVHRWAYIYDDVVRPKKAHFKRIN